MIAEESWVIKPGIIESLSGERRSMIADDLRYAQGERQLWQPYDGSIFDDLRKKYLNKYKDILNPERKKEELDTFQIHPREDRVIRESRMLKDIGKQQHYNDYRRNFQPAEQLS